MNHKLNARYPLEPLWLDGFKGIVRAWSRSSRSTRLLDGPKRLSGDSKVLDLHPAHADAYSSLVGAFISCAKYPRGPYSVIMGQLPTFGARPAKAVEAVDALAK
jgi:hypothetical protein